MALAIYSNNATTTLTSLLLISDTVANITSGTETTFPSPTGGNWFWATLVSATNSNIREIVKCTNRTGTALTIVRAQQGTTALQFSAGDTLEHRITAQDLTDLQTPQAGTVIETRLLKTVSGGTVTLTAAEETNSIFEIQGTLLSNCTIIFSNNPKHIFVDNLTTGDFTLTFKTAAGSGITVPRGQTAILYNNGTNIEDASTNKQDSFISINPQIGTTYTFVLSDAGKLVTFSNASPVTVTVPSFANVTFPIGTRIDCIQDGVGKVTFAPDVGVTINSAFGNKSIFGQYVGVSLIKESQNIWYLIGSLIA